MAPQRRFFERSIFWWPKSHARKLRKLSRGAGVPINLNGRKALRPEKLAGQPWKPTGHTNSAGKQRGGGYVCDICFCMSEQRIDHDRTDVDDGGYVYLCMRLPISVH